MSMATMSPSSSSTEPSSCRLTPESEVGLRADLPVASNNGLFTEFVKSATLQAGSILDRLVRDIAKKREELDSLDESIRTAHETRQRYLSPATLEPVQPVFNLGKQVEQMGRSRHETEELLDVESIEQTTTDGSFLQPQYQHQSRGVNIRKMRLLDRTSGPQDGTIANLIDDGIDDRPCAKRLCIEQKDQPLEPNNLATTDLTAWRAQDNSHTEPMTSGPPQLLNLNRMNLSSTIELVRATIGADHELIPILSKMSFRCHVCGSCFEDRHRLQQHLSIHLQLKPSWFEERTIAETMAKYELRRGDYLCTICNLRYDTTADFDKHMQLHGDRPHECDLCAEENKFVSFRLFRQLLTHLRSHCFIYNCRFTPECKQTANRKDYLKLHILKHHLNNKLSEQNIARFH